MKVLGIIGAVMGAIAGILGVYLQFVLVEAASIAESRWTSTLNESYYGSIEHRLDMAAMEAVTDFGVIVMGVGLLAFLLSIVPAIKKIKVAWVGVGLGLIAFFIGAAHGTHMFS